MGFIHGRLDMSGRVAIVTGGGRNLGRGIVLGLADAGATVVIAEVDEDTGPAMEKSCATPGTRRSSSTPTSATPTPSRR